MIATAADLLARLPGKVTAAWPDGERFATALAHGSMSVEVYAPRGADPQTPHDQDELYFPISGSATLRIGEDTFTAKAGTVHFVPAGADHRFERFSEDFATWVVFWGPKGGEKEGARCIHNFMA
jgi:mannose-6-phosphate isomerase-like protein (cupin superfamily)